MGAAKPAEQENVHAQRKDVTESRDTVRPRVFQMWPVHKELLATDPASSAKTEKQVEDAHHRQDHWQCEQPLRHP
jgi:hypothetical protein